MDKEEDIDLSKMLNYDDWEEFTEEVEDPEKYIMKLLRLDKSGLQNKLITEFQIKFLLYNYGENSDNDLEHKMDIQTVKFTLNRLKGQISAKYAKAKNDGEKRIKIAIQEGLMPEELVKEIDEEEKEDIIEFYAKFSITDELLSFYTLSYELIKTLSADLLEDKLIEERYRSTNETEKLINDKMSQRMREQFLYRTGIISNNIHSKMVQARKFRNKIVHDFREKHTLSSIEDLEKEMEKIRQVINELHKRLKGNIVWHKNEDFQKSK